MMIRVMSVCGLDLDDLHPIVIAHVFVVPG